MADFDIIEDMLSQTSDEIHKMIPINVVLIGKTGVGKSTLINAFFRENLAETGIGRPVTESLIKISKEGIPLNIYDSKGLELNVHTQKKILDEIIQFINKQNRKKLRDKIHLVYYCINSTSSRIEDYEIELINSIGKVVPVIIVLTQSIGVNSDELFEYITKLKLNTVGVVPILARDYVINKDIVIESKGLKELLELSFQSIPDELYPAFNNAQFIDIDKKVQSARRWAKKYIYTTFGVGFVPIPFSDASIIVPMQVTMLAHITAIIGLNMDRQKLTAIIASLGGTTGATFLGRNIVSNILKFIPGVGSVVGGVISGATASILTSALANSYIEVLKIIATKERQGHQIDFSEIESLMKTAFNKYYKQKDK